MKIKHLASDNFSGICPEAIDYIQKANTEDDFAYGEDKWTDIASDRLREFFDIECDVFFVFNGTAANSLALSSLCQSYHSIICSDFSHAETDECGAPEFFSNGSKILLGESTSGKLTPASIENLVTKRVDIHYPKPKVVSLTQSTELGTVYNTDELMGIRYIADKYDLKVHMDGARFSNAVVSSGKSPAELSWKVGVDVLCFGGTKNGLSAGEAVIFFNKELSQEFAYRCKQAGQLASKMRFLSCQWIALLETDAWKKNAENANSMANYLAEKLTDLDIQPIFPVEANSVFVELPETSQMRLHDLGWNFYNFIGSGGCRFMSSWNTTENDINVFVSALGKALKSG